MKLFACLTFLDYNYEYNEINYYINPFSCFVKSMLLKSFCVKIKFFNLFYASKYSFFLQIDISIYLHSICIQLMCLSIKTTINTIMSSLSVAPVLSIIIVPQCVQSLNSGNFWRIVVLRLHVSLWVYKLHQNHFQNRGG